MAFHGSVPAGPVRKLTSGYRTPAANKAQGGAENSHHLYGEAADVEDQNRDLAIFCYADPAILKHFGLFIEDPRWSRERNPKTGLWSFWVHFQTVAPPSGKRIFIPNSSPPPRS